MIKEFTLFSVSCMLVLLLMPAVSVAQTPKVVFSTGVKGAAGGNQMVAQDAPRNNDEAQYFEEGVPFEGDIIGSGGGGGIFGEVRFLGEHVGVELDVLWDVNRARCVVEQISHVDVDYILTYSMLRVPLLFKVAFKGGGPLVIRFINIMQGTGCMAANAVGRFAGAQFHQFTVD